MENSNEANYCGRAVCSAMDGHEGTCAEASGWDEAEIPAGTINLMAAIGRAVESARAQRRLDREPCPRCGGDRLRPDFTGSGRCHAEVSR